MSAVKNNIPKTVKVLYKNYDLIQRQSTDEILSNGSYGTHYPVLSKIEWVKHSKPEDNVDTIIHELLHAVFDLFRIKENDTEEEIVTKLSTGMTTLMKDNKKLFYALLDML